MNGDYQGYTSVCTSCGAYTSGIYGSTDADGNHVLCHICYIHYRENNKTEPTIPKDRMLKWFSYTHLPENLQETSKPFRVLAEEITDKCHPGPERTVALRKLLEAKDATIRAKVYPGG